MPALFLGFEFVILRFRGLLLVYLGSYCFVSGVGVCLTSGCFAGYVLLYLIGLLDS